VAHVYAAAEGLTASERDPKSKAAAEIEQAFDWVERNLTHGTRTRELSDLGAARAGKAGVTANPVCGFQPSRSCAKASGGRPARWQSRTARVWLASLRSQRATRCHSSRARTRLAW
jgi:hypothetical protein